MFLVLHVVSGLDVGGAEMMLYRLINASDKSRCRHIVVSLGPKGNMRSRFVDAGIELHIFNFKKSPFLEFFRLWSLIKNFRPSIVQTWLYHADLIGGLAAKFAGIDSIVWGIRTTNVAKGGSNSVLFARWLCARFSNWLPHTIIFPAESAKQFHINYGFSAKKSVVIPNGFNVDGYIKNNKTALAIRASCGFSGQTLVIGSVGRFNKAKDQLNFLKAASLLVKKFPNVRFLLIGRECDASNSKLMNWINLYDLSKKIVLLGERNDIADCLSAMDIFVLSSRTEAFPNALAEAMVAELPCISTDVGDASYVLGDYGELVPPQDCKLLATAVERVLILPKHERKALGLMSRERIKKLFSMERSANLFFLTYQQIIAGTVRR